MGIRGAAIPFMETTKSMQSALWLCRKLGRPFGVAASGLFLLAVRLRARCVRRITTQPLLVIVPHQDDETLGCGGLIALKRRAGAPVAVVYLTDGTASHRGHPVMTPAALATIRRAEATAALGRLGVLPQHIHFLDGPDGALAHLQGKDRSDLIERVAVIVRAMQPAAVATTLRSDAHPDHEAACALAVEALRLAGSSATLLEFPLWARWFAPWENWSLLCGFAWSRVDIAEVRGAKLSAVAEFVSQLRPIPPWTTRHLRPAFVRRCTGRWEYFMGGPGGDI